MLLFKANKLARNMKMNIEKQEKTNIENILGVSDWTQDSDVQSRYATAESYF